MRFTSRQILHGVGVCVCLVPVGVAWGGFTDVTSSTIAGLAAGNSAWCDYNNDGYPDLHDAFTLWRNNGGTNFTAVGAHTWGIWGDYDNDGFQDLYTWQGTGTLFHNDGGTGFTTAPMPPLPKDTTAHYDHVSRGGCWGDFDNDGFLDLYIGGFELWDEQADFPDIIWRNHCGLSFTTNWTQLSEPPVDRARGIAACDFDEDGDQDIYVSNYRLRPNILWLNDGSGNFTDVAATYGVAGETWGIYPYGHTVGSAWGDMDNDGYIDLFVGNFRHGWDDGSQDHAKFMRNQGPGGSWHFSLMAELDGADWQESYGIPMVVDYDNDGDLDLYYTTLYPGDAARLYRNDGHWRFTDVTTAEGLGAMPPTHQNCWADYNHDGFLDLATGNRLYKNLGNANHWLRIKLVGNGTTINRDAVGAQVRIDLGGGTVLTRQVEGGTSEGSQNELTLHFGLGTRVAPVDLEVLWPDGTTQRINDVSVDQAITRAAPPASILGEIPTGVPITGNPGSWNHVDHEASPAGLFPMIQNVTILDLPPGEVWEVVSVTLTAWKPSSSTATGWEVFLAPGGFTNNQAWVDASPAGANTALGHACFAGPVAVDDVAYPGIVTNFTTATVDFAVPILLTGGAYYLDIRPTGGTHMKFARDGGINSYAGGEEGYFQPGGPSVGINPNHDLVFGLYGIDRPELGAVEVSQALRMEFLAADGWLYRLETSTPMAGDVWNETGARLLGNGETNAFFLPFGTPTSTVYRVLIE